MGERYDWMDAKGRLFKIELTPADVRDFGGMRSTYVEGKMNEWIEARESPAGANDPMPPDFVFDGQLIRKILRG